MSSTTFQLQNVECIDLKRSSHPISTGIGFLDHMLDQLNSHAQVGVAVSVQTEAAGAEDPSRLGDKNRFAELNQHDLAALLGEELGKRIKSIIPQKASRRSRFCCPLDEALVECILSNQDLPTTEEVGGEPLPVFKFDLTPYGNFPKNQGRKRIGQLETSVIQTLFSSLSKHMCVSISLTKIRGNNGHHIVESAFKAFSRALRNFIDGVDTSDNGSPNVFWTKNVENQLPMTKRRDARIERSTKETSIKVDLAFDHKSATEESTAMTDKCIQVETGVKTLNQFFATLAHNAQLQLNISCKGDLWVDDHHTSEDVSIAVGQCLCKALGAKEGLNRMWCAQAKHGGALVEVTMDLSNRPCLTHNLPLEVEGAEEYIGDMSSEMFDHVLDSLVANGRMTVHINHLDGKGQTIDGKRKRCDLLDVALAAAAAMGKALYMCSAVDSRRKGKTASSKGTLSV